MLLGFNMLLWTTFVAPEHYPLLKKLKKVGYDGVELTIFGGKPEDYVEVGRVLKDEGLRATAVAVIPDKAHDCTSSDPKVRAAGLEHLKWAIDCLAAAGGEVLCGPFYQPLGIFTGVGPTKEELAPLPAAIPAGVPSRHLTTMAKPAYPSLNRRFAGRWYMTCYD